MKIDAISISSLKKLLACSHTKVYLLTLSFLLNTLFLCAPLAAQSDYSWEKFAGVSNAQGHSDSSSSTPRLNSPNDVVQLADGSLLISDTGNQVIRKRAANGIVSTFVGLKGIHGASDGVGENARFNAPGALALAPNGTVYVADTGNIVVKKITPAGVVTTFAGIAGHYGTTNGAAASSTFSYIADIALDSMGNLFVVDTDNHCVRKISSAGIVSTFVGSNDLDLFGSADGTGTAARFNYPTSITVAPNDDLYILDTGNGTIRKATPAGVVTTLPIGAVAEGYSRIEALPTGELICTDSTNHKLVKIINENTIQLLAGGNTPGNIDATGASAKFNYPVGIHRASDGNFYITDLQNHLIRKCTPDGVVTWVVGVANTPGSDDSDSTGAKFAGPTSIHVDETQQIVICDTGNHTLRLLNKAGATITHSGLADDPGSSDGTLPTARYDSPSGICKFGSYYLIADTLNHTIRKIDGNGNVSTLAGQAGSSGNANGTGSAARFNRPNGIAIDDNGNAFVADRSSNTIRKITPSGDVTTIAGSANLSGSDDGFAGAARFNRPTGIAIDTNGNLYVSDQNNHTIRKISSAGDVSTIAGTIGLSGLADGMGSSALFSSPAGLAIDSQGGLLIADQGNNAIRRLTLNGQVMTLTDSGSNLNAPKGISESSDGRIFVTSSAANTIVVGSKLSSDQDGDGYSDWQELVQGLPSNAHNTGFGQPTQASLQNWPTATDSKQLLFTFRCWPGIDHGFNYRVQESNDLANWTDTNMQTNRIGLPQPSGDAIPVERVTVRANTSMNEQNRLFMRLCLDEPWPPNSIGNASVDLGSMKLHADANIAAIVPQNTHTKQAYDTFSASGNSQWSRFGWTSKIDLSKIAWETTQDCTLISPRHVLMSTHWKRGIGASVVFHDRYGVAHTRILQNVKIITSPNVDVTVGLLNSPVSLGMYKVLPKRSDWNSYLQNSHVLVTNRLREVLVRKIQAINNYVHYNFSSNYPTYYQPNVVPGDSGNPGFLLYKGEPVLISIFHYGGTGSGPFISDPPLFDAINTAMLELGGGHQLTTVTIE